MLELNGSSHWYLLIDLLNNLLDLWSLVHLANSDAFQRFSRRVCCPQVLAILCTEQSKERASAHIFAKGFAAGAALACFSAWTGEELRVHHQLWMLIHQSLYNSIPYISTYLSIHPSIYLSIKSISMYIYIYYYIRIYCIPYPSTYHWSTQPFPHKSHHSWEAKALVVSKAHQEFRLSSAAHRPWRPETAATVDSVKSCVSNL